MEVREFTWKFNFLKDSSIYKNEFIFEKKKRVEYKTFNIKNKISFSKISLEMINQHNYLIT